MCELLEKVAISAIKDRKYYFKTWKTICKDREKFYIEINKLKNFKCYKSYANFVLIKSNPNKLINLIKSLSHKGIIVKKYDKPPFVNCIRITVGKTKDMNKILKIFKKLDI